MRSTKIDTDGLEVGASSISPIQVRPVTQTSNALAAVDCAPSDRAKGYKCVAGLTAQLQHSCLRHPHRGLDH